jgi:hypothetical protein
MGIEGKICVLGLVQILRQRRKPFDIRQGLLPNGNGAATHQDASEFFGES